MKNDLKRKAVSTILAGSLIFSSGALSNKVDASYALNKPTTTYEQFNNYSGVKIFINGRLVEFNDSLGYPYISAEGRTMIPLRAVAETFTATVNYDGVDKMAIVSKHDILAEVKIDYNKIRINENEVITTDTKAIIKNGRTYIPLRALFENFGLNVRWDNNTKTAHIETLGNNPFPYIDFKEKNLISIKDVDTSIVNKVIYDGVEVNKKYVDILKNSDQYKVFVENGVCNIFSYQYLTDLNYIYQKIDENYKNIVLDKVTRLKYITDDEFNLLIDTSWAIFVDGLFSTKGEDLRGKSYITNYGINLKEYKTCIPYAVELANEAKNYSSNKEEQVKYVINKINKNTKYDENTAPATAYDTFVNKVSSCMGYQAAFEMVMEELGIPCLNVSGGVKSVDDHMWGHVYINGRWSSIDCTNKMFEINKEDEVKYGNRQINKDLINLLELTYKFN